MPNILVYIDVRDGRPTAPALFALSEARRVARLAGASTFAIVTTAPLATDELEALARPIAEAGADKLLVCEADDFGGPVQDATHGRALDATLARVSPMLVLFPPGSTASALAPALAARLGAPYAPWCDFTTTDAEVPAPEGAGRVQLTRLRPDGRSSRRLDPVEIKKPVVATLVSGRRPTPTGSLQHLEIEVVATGKPVAPSLAVETERMPNPYAAFELASVLVLIGDIAPDGPLHGLSSEALAALAPAGTIVARASEVPRAVLATCCPEVLLKIGSSSAMTARSPRTRVVLAVAAGTVHPDVPAATATTAAAAAAAAAAAVPTPDDVDVLWQIQSPDDLTPSALKSLLAQIGDRR